MTEYTDKTAIVTGAGWGIGYEISKQLLIRGANVILNDINPDRAEEAREKLSEFHHENNLCIPIAGDAGDPAVIDQMVDVADREFGGIHYVVANAGIRSEERRVGKECRYRCVKDRSKESVEDEHRGTTRV